MAKTFNRGDAVVVQVGRLYGMDTKEGRFLTEFTDLFKEYYVVVQLQGTGELVVVGINYVTKK